MEQGQRERTTEVARASASSGVRTDSQGKGAGKWGSHGAPFGGHGFLLPLCLAKGGEQSKGEREIAEEGRDSGVHFVSSAHAHAPGELAGMEAARAPRDLQRLCMVSAELQFTVKIPIPPQKCIEISIFVPS